MCATGVLWLGDFFRDGLRDVLYAVQQRVEKHSGVIVGDWSPLGLSPRTLRNIL